MKSPSLRYQVTAALHKKYGKESWQPMYSLCAADVLDILADCRGISMSAAKKLTHKQLREIVNDVIDATGDAIPWGDYVKAACIEVLQQRKE